MKRLIFLDIDGVLNSAQFRAENTNGEGVVIVDGAFDATAHIDPLRVARLNRLIDTTGAEVVLSSSWRKLFGRERTQFSLKAKGFAHQITDCTVRLVGELRHVEIESYLAALGTHPRFVIFDDAEEAGVGFGPNFIHVLDGLEDDHIERACRILLEGDIAEQSGVE
jgi:hypothetical protein